MSGSRSSSLTRLAELCLGLLLLGGCLALASAPVWTLGPSVALAGMAAVTMSLGARAEERPLRPPVFAALLLVPVIACALQLVPLPQRWLGLLSPRAAEIVDFVLVPLGLSSSRPVSLDPPATWRALAGALTALLVFLTASHLVRREGAQRRLGLGLAFLAAALPVLAGLHWLAGTERLYGLYTFRVSTPALITPFGNPNHLAGFLGLGAAVALGAARSTRTRGRLRWALYGAWALSSAGVLASGSLGGVLAWVIGQLTFVLLVWRAERAEGPGGGGKGRRRWEAPALVVGLVLLFLLGLSAVRPLEAELLETASVGGLASSKLELLPGFAAMATEFGWVGAGRGAFEAAWPRFADRARGDTFTHPEHAPLQWATEFGFPIAVILLLGVLWSGGWLLSRRRMGSLQLGALAGLVGLCLQNLVDFSLELTFLANTALVALAIAWGAPTKPQASGSPLRFAGHVPVVLAALAGVVGLFAALGPGRSTLDGATDALRDAIAAGRPAAEVQALAVKRIDRHPAHWTPHALAAQSIAGGSATPRDALAFANRALFLHPHHGPTHRVAARALLRLGAREQAFIEYRLAARAGDGGAVTEALSHARSTSERVSLTPDPARARHIARQLPEAAQAIAYLQEVPFRFPDATGLELARLALDEARLHLTAKDLTRAAEAGERASALAPGALETELGRARLLRAMGSHEASLGLLKTLWARHPGPAVGFALVEGALAQRTPKAAFAALTQTRPFLSAFDERARWLELEAQIYDLEGAFHRAIASRRNACRLTPTAACHFRLARALERMGDVAQARDAVRTGARLGPQPPPETTTSWLGELERRLAAQQGGRDGASGSAGMETDALLRRLGER